MSTKNQFIKIYNLGHEQHPFDDACFCVNCEDLRNFIEYRSEDDILDETERLKQEYLNFENGEGDVCKCSICQMHF